MTFAEKLKTLRKRKGITQMQLAAATNISLGVIADIESGRHDPSKASAKRLSEFFDVPIQVFIVENYDINTKETYAPKISMKQILMIADIVQQYLQSNGYTLTDDQRVALVEHFCQENISDANQIRQQLSVLAAVQSSTQKG